MFQRRHGWFGRIGKRRKRAGGSKRSMVAVVVGSVWNIAKGAVAGRQTPAVGAVALKMFGIRNAIGAVNQGNVPIVFKVGRREAVVQAVRIEGEIRVVSEEKRPACAHADVEFYAVVIVPVRIVIPIFGA